MLIHSHSIHGVCGGAQQGAVLVTRHIQAANDAIFCANGNREAIWGQPQGRDRSLMLGLQTPVKPGLQAAHAAGNVRDILSDGMAQSFSENKRPTFLKQGKMGPHSPEA